MHRKSAAWLKPGFGAMGSFPFLIRSNAAIIVGILAKILRALSILAFMSLVVGLGSYKPRAETVVRKASIGSLWGGYDRISS